MSSIITGRPAATTEYVTATVREWDDLVSLLYAESNEDAAHMMECVLADLQWDDEVSMTPAEVWQQGVSALTYGKWRLQCLAR